MKKRTSNLLMAALVFICFLNKTDLVRTQITSDGTLSTQIQTTNSFDFTIINGNQVGSNLFHSFREFSVPTGGSASFANDLDVKNIISRVTGVSVSNIDGLLKTNGSANLFLINPNGISFGSKAQLNIGGSFVASTASHLLFADGTQFSATDVQVPPLLTVSVPVGLQFGQTAKPIQIEASILQVLSGKTFALVGGDVLIKGGTLTAPAGRIDIGSVAANSLISLIPITEGFVLRYEGVQNFQDIQVSQNAWIDTSDEGHGAIQLRARRIAIADNSQVGGITLGEKPGQPLTIQASEFIEVSGPYSKLLTLTLGAGAAGDITIVTKRLLIGDRGSIDASTGSSGSGGSLNVFASDSVELLGDGFFTSLGTRSLSSNNDAGNAGTVRISTRQLVLRDGGLISTSTLGPGNGGILIVDASESVEMSGRSVADVINIPSSLLADSRNPGRRRTTGNGGDLIVKTQRLVVQDGASISVAAINGSTGQAGRLDINSSDSVTVTGTGIGRNSRIVPSRLLAASEGSGSAGDLRIHTGTLTIRDGAEVSVSNTGAGTTGDLQITANNLLLDQGKLTAETTGGQGNINLNSDNLILRRNSQITTNATGSNITGGNITLDTDILTALENSDISANSSEFRGGNIQINASAIFGTQFRNGDTTLSDITATGANSQLSGTIQINTPDVDPTSGLIELPVDVVDPTQLIAQGCPAARGNSFTVTGRGGLPPLPGEMLHPNNTVSVDWVTGNEQEQRGTSAGVQGRTLNHGSTPSSQLLEANAWVTNSKGEVMLIASAPTVKTNVSSFTPSLCP